MVGKKKPGRFTWKAERELIAMAASGGNRAADRQEISDHGGHDRAQSEAAGCQSAEG
jgi:hypothetical protein